MKLIINQKSKRACRIAENIILLNARIAALKEQKEKYQKSNDTTGSFFLDLELKDQIADREEQLKELKTIEKF